MPKRNLRRTALAALVAAETLSNASGVLAKRESAGVEVTLTISNACTIVTASHKLDPLDLLAAQDRTRPVAIDCVARRTPYGVSSMADAQDAPQAPANTQTDSGTYPSIVITTIEF